VVTISTVFRECAFRHCQSAGSSFPDNRGVALFLNNTQVNLGVARCVFESCRAASFAGAIEVMFSLSFRMTETIGVNCSCPS
jgi:hypothetical protein